MNKRLLDSISVIDDIHNLTDEQLCVLARELREEILATTSVTGGHVASSLGAVDLILAIHSLINSPSDKLLFDVGHQAYAHKLLTGRLNQFHTLRQHGGISGFPKPSETEHDVYASGHASDSLSVALGLAKARDLCGGSEKIVTVIGDASIAGGMAFEALNHIGQAQCPMTIILNDNEMSIGKNVGALMRHLGMMRASSEYGRAKDALQGRLDNSGAFVRGMLSFGKNWKDSVKQFILPHSMIYENLGIVCTVPIDGHNISLLREVIGGVIDADVPVLVHVVTKKGAGYKPAMQDPIRFHGTGPFDIESGRAIKIEKVAKCEKPDECENAGKAGAGAKATQAAKSLSSKTAKNNLTFTEVMGDALCAAAKKDESILAITAAMAKGTGLLGFREKFPSRFIDTGIAEGHAVGLAAGLAIGKRKPVICLYSTFFQRAIDQTIINVALLNLPVVFCIDRAGLVGADGPTHHGVFDIAFMRSIPNMHVLTPSCARDLRDGLNVAFDMGVPVAIRYPKGVACECIDCLPACEKTDGDSETSSNYLSNSTAHVNLAAQTAPTLDVGRAHVLQEGADISILAFGSMVSVALQVSSKLSDLSVQVVDMRWAKPLDEDAIARAAKTRLVVTLEDGVVFGGAGMGVLEVLSRRSLRVNTLVLGIPDDFVGAGSIEELRCDVGLDADSIVDKIRNSL